VADRCEVNGFGARIALDACSVCVARDACLACVMAAARRSRRDLWRHLLPDERKAMRWASDWGTWSRAPVGLPISQSMTTIRAVEPPADGEDFGFVQHMAAIKDLYQKALADIAAVAESWPQPPVDRSDVAGPPTGELIHIRRKPPVPVEHEAA
jgi:hypothetical protein